MSGISGEQALDCFASDDLIGIGMEADAVRRRLHQEGVVSYAIDRVFDCSALDRVSGDELQAACEETLEAGGTGLVLRGLALRELSSVEQLLSRLSARFPGLCIQAASATEIAALASSAGSPLRETLQRLRDAGLSSILGTDAETAAQGQWLQVHRVAHRAGMSTSAELTFGNERVEDRVSFLQSVRRLQEETGGFVAFTLTTLPAPSRRELDDPTAVEYLKTLAICRMLLDNVPNLQANWEQQGLKVLQMALRFGANDAGSLLGTVADASEEEVRQVIRHAGFKPAQRASMYNAMFL